MLDSKIRCCSRDIERQKQLRVGSILLSLEIRSLRKRVGSK